MQLEYAIELLLKSCDRIFLGYSGGVDSHVLLHLLIMHYRLPVTVVHVNHQLNPKAEQWSLHCQQICDDLNVPLHIEKIQIACKSGDSLEEKAREARYTVLKKYIDKNSVLVTAHNLNDQAETFLFQALRGSGTKGLSAMPVKKKFSEGFLIRPLLTISRDEIEEYAQKHQLIWIEDDSNTNTKFNRNFLRHDIFPLLKKRFPKCMENFARSAALMAEQEKIIREISEQDLLAMTQTHTLSVIELSKYSEPRQRLILREWFRVNHLRMPSAKHLKQILKDVVHAAWDAHPVFHFDGVILRREKKHLFIEKKELSRPLFQR